MEVAALEIQIGANIDEAVKGFQKIDVYTDRFGKSINELKDDLISYKETVNNTLNPQTFIEYSKKIIQVESEIANRFEAGSQAILIQNSALAKGQTQLQRTTKAASGANNAMFALSGIVQDAPFGWRAIGNNITFSAQQLVYFVKEAGGGAQALKLLGSSLLGPAGLIFGLSAATSLITFFTDRSAKAKKEAADLADSIKDLADANLKGSQDAQEQVVNLDLLYKAATNVKKSMSERLAAVKELQKEYPSYFKNQSQETILAGGAAKAYENLKNQILATSRARAAAETIVENQKQILKLETDLTDQEAERNKVLLEQQKASDNAEAVSGMNALSQTGNIATGSILNLGNKISELNDKISNTRDAIAKLNKENLKLKDSVNVIDLVKPTPVPAPGIQGKPDVKTIQQAALFANQALQNTTNSFRSFTQTTTASVSNQLIPSLVNIQKNFSQVGELVDQQDPKIAKLAGTAALLAPIFDDVFTTIAGGGDGFKSLISDIGQVIAKMAALAAAAAIAAALVAAATGGSNFAAAADVAGSFKNIFQSLSGIKLAKGGIAYGPTTALIGEYSGARNNPEVVAPLDRLQQLIGDGGERKIEITGNFRLVGNDLYTAVRRAQDRTSRYNG